MARTSGGTAAGGGGGITAIAQASDVGLTSPQPGDALEFDNASSTFKNRPVFWLTPRSRGAVADSRRFFGLNTTLGSAVVTAGAPVFPNPAGTAAEIAEAAFLVGKTISIDYAGAVDATVTAQIVSVDSTTQITLNANAGQTKYGKCTGRIHGTDAKAAIQACIDQAAAIPSGLGGVLIEGVYSYAGDLSIRDNTWMEGTGRWRSGLMLKPSAGAVHMVKTENFTAQTLQSGTTNGNRGTHNFALHRMFFDGNQRNNATAKFGLALYGFDFDLKDLVICYVKGVGLWSEVNMSSNIPAGSGTGSSDAPNLYGTGPGGIHTYLDRVLVFGCADSNTNTTIGANLGAQVALFGPHDSYWRGLDVYGSGNACAYGILFGHSGAGGGVDGVGGSQGSAFHVWGNHVVGLRVASGGTMLDNIQSEGGTTQIQIAGDSIKLNHVRAYGVTGSALGGLEFVSGDDIQVTGLKVENCDTFAIKFSGGSPTLLTGSASSTNATPPPLLVGTVPTTLEAVFMGTEGYDRSFIKRGGHTILNTDCATSGFGTTASVTVRAGSNVYRGEIAVLSGGTGQAASPTVTLTFPKPFTGTPFVVCTRQNLPSGNVNSFMVSALSNTAVSFMYTGTPGGGTTYTVSYWISE